MADDLGVALGVESVECALTANAVVLTTIEIIIAYRTKNTDKGINMQMVTDVQRIVIAVEHHLLSVDDDTKKTGSIKTA